jgi:hypothetical protein
MLGKIYITVPAGQVAGGEYMEKNIPFSAPESYCSRGGVHQDAP